MLRYPWAGGSWSLRNTGPEFPCFTAVDMVLSKELGLGQSWDRGGGWCWESDTGTNDPCVTAAAVST